MPDATDGRIVVHATAVAIAGRGVLLRGPSGAGKSDLALRCLMRGQTPFSEGPIALIGDDYIELRVREAAPERTSGAGGGKCILEARAASETIRGLVEVRGVGLFRVRALDMAPVELVVDLTDRPETIARLPRAEDASVEIAGVRVARIRLDPFQASAVEKIIIAVSGERIGDDRLAPFSSNADPVGDGPDSDKPGT